MGYITELGNPLHELELKMVEISCLILKGWLLNNGYKQASYA